MGRLLLVVLFAGCASVSAERGHDRVGELVRQRTGHRTQWEKGPPEDGRVAEWVRATAKAGLTRDRVVEIALVNNPQLAEAYEELGVAQADMVQAGLLRNPSLGVELGLPVTDQGLSEARFSLVQDFLDLFVLPARKQIAREQFEADTLRTAHEALSVVAEAEKAFTEVQATAQMVAFRRAVVEATQAAAELADKQFEAGNIGPLEHSSERATYEQAKLELAREELAQLESRERLNRLLGLWGETTTWQLAQPLPEIPATDPGLEHLETLAVRQRLDLASARAQATLLGKAVGLARSTRAFGRLEIGVDAHRDPDGPRVIGPNLVIELPLFDQRQATIARLEAQRRQQERRLAGMAIEARSEVRIADARVRAARQTVTHYRDVLVPLRQAVLEQSLLHYNGMLIGLPQLLAAKQGEVEARRGYIEASRDYWIAWAELERSVGGRLPAGPPGTPRAAPMPSKEPPQEGTHQHGQ